MNPLELITLARALINGVTSDDAVSPTRTELRRAVSCAYYAMFHTLAASNANSLAGASPADQQGWAWQQTYRAADHRPTRNKLSRTSLGGRLPRAIHLFGESVHSCPTSRHSADYDPHSEFYATDVTGLIDKVEEAVAAFNQTPNDIRRDLTVHILTTVRSD